MGHDRKMGLIPSAGYLQNQVDYKILRITANTLPVDLKEYAFRFDLERNRVEIATNGRCYHRMVILLRGILVLLILARSISAQMPDAAPGAVELGDGLSLHLPTGWKTEVVDKSTAGPDHSPTDGANNVTLLLRARPFEDQRTARLTIIRDITFGGRGGPMGKADLLSRLSEIAMAQGFQPGKITEKGRIGSPSEPMLAQIDGAAADGRKRTFTCLSVGRFPNLYLRCYWEYDPADSAVQTEFDNCLSSLTFNNLHVADALNSNEGMMPANAARPVSTIAKETSPISSPTPAPPSAESGQLVNKYHNSLILVKGSKGTGSGFLCNLNGGQWLFTNAHVLSDNPQPRFIPIGGTPLAPGSASLAVDRDICKMAMPTGTNAIDAMTSVDSEAKIGDAIAVLGNAEGTGVIHPFDGHIVGLGPDLVEVDAPFVPGNSGSPIIHVASGKVIGIATYLLIKKVDESGTDKNVQTTIRRFGYRIDNVKTWEPVNWVRFYAQSAQAARIEDNSQQFLDLFAAAKADKILSTEFANPGIRRALESFSGRLGKTKKISPADLTFARRELFSNLRNTSLIDIKAFDSRTAYDYFRRTVADETKFREEIYTNFTRAINANN